MGPDGALSSDEVNFLIYRYLLEAGKASQIFLSVVMAATSFLY